MSSSTEKTLYRRLQGKGFEPEHVAEVGVYVPDTSNVYDYIMNGVRTTLVEPDPESISRIRKSFGHLDHVTLHPVAAYDFNGPLKLAQRAASTFVSELDASPAIVNDGYVVAETDEFTVESVTFDRIDDGTIDVLSVDTEGSEWFVLKHMKSRPAVISIETHGAAYVNPHLDDIREWMRDNGYRLFFRDKSDSVYVIPDVVALAPGDWWRLQWKNLMLGLRRARRRLFGAWRRPETTE